METRHIRFLHEVATNGSVSGAARALGLTQSALTKIVARVEDELGTKLFHRTARGVEPNEFGEVFLNRARRIGMEMADLVSEIRTMKSGLSGTVALGTGQAWIFGALPAAVARVNAEYPGIEVRVRTGRFDDLMAGLQRGDLDFLLAQVRPASSNDEVEIESIADTVLHVTARHGHPLATKRRALRPNDFADYQWVLPPVGDPVRDRLVDLLTARGAPGPAVAVETTSYQLTARIMAESELLSLFPAAAGTVYADSLVALSADWCIHRRAAGIVTLRTRAQTMAVTHFLDIMRAAARAAR